MLTGKPKGSVAWSSESGKERFSLCEKDWSVFPIADLIGLLRKSYMVNTLVPA